jgi:SprT protein
LGFRSTLGILAPIFFGAFVLLDRELQHQTIKQVAHCIQQAERYFDVSLPQPKISYQLRGKAAGKAYLQLWEIRLNPVLFSENPDAFINEVIPHEIAHLLCYKLFGRVRPHGKEWQAIMLKVFGVNPNTTHSFDVASVQGKTFQYRCTCNDYALTIRRHNKVQRQQAAYRCSLCHEQLQFTGKQLS